MKTFENLPSTNTPISAENLNKAQTDILIALGLNQNNYDSTETYAKGDVIIYNNTLYECNKNNVTGNFDESKWDLLPIIDSDYLNQKLINTILTYSTDEYYTGRKWIDGKKIYGRVYRGTLGTPITHGLNNVDIFMEPHGFYIGASGGTFPLPSTRPNYPAYACGIYVNNSQIMFDKGESVSELTCYITLEYTKTTD